MGPWITQAKSKIQEIMEAATKIDQRATTRISFVGYRDFEDTERFVVTQFTTGLNTIRSQLSPINASGGGDAPEDIAGGLDQVLKLDWECNTRLLIHVADAPCHGSSYHSGLFDNHPDGGFPAGKRPEDLLAKLCNKEINYYFVRINSSTDIMTKIFQEVYRKANSTFEIHDLGTDASRFLPAVLSSIKDSISRSAAFRDVKDSHRAPSRSFAF